MSGNGSDGNGASYSFGRARVAGGLVLIFAAVALALIDAVSVDYTVEPIQTGLFLGTGAVLLGVEAVKKVIGG